MCHLSLSQSVTVCKEDIGSKSQELHPAPVCTAYNQQAHNVVTSGAYQHSLGPHKSLLTHPKVCLRAEHHSLTDVRVPGGWQTVLDLHIKGVLKAAHQGPSQSLLVDLTLRASVDNNDGTSFKCALHCYLCAVHVHYSTLLLTLQCPSMTSYYLLPQTYRSGSNSSRTWSHSNNFSDRAPRIPRGRIGVPRGQIGVK